VKPINNNYQDAYLALSKPEKGGSVDYCSTAMGPDGVKALALGRKLLWDAEILGEQYGRIDALWARSKEALTDLERAFDDVLRQMDSDGVKVCDVRIGLHAYSLIHMAEARGFRLMDALNIYLSQSPLKSVAEGSCRVIEGRIENIKHREEVLRIGAKCFTHSRIYADPRIPKERGDLFYQRLLNCFLLKEKACTGLALGEAGEVCGFYLGHEDEGNSDLGYLWLLAVAPGHRGKGIGEQLLNSFLREMHRRCSFVEIGTQVNNHAANSLYQQAGLRTAANAATLHRWF